MKSIENKSVFLLLCVLLFTVLSCGDIDLFDTDKWSSKIEGWEPGIKGAVAHGEFTLWDLLRDTAQDATIVKECIDGDTVLVIQYTKENIYSLDVAEVFELEKTDIVFEKVFDLPEDLDVIGGVKVEDLYPDGFELKDSIAEMIPIPVEYDGTLLKQVELNQGMCTYLLPQLDDVEYEVQVFYYSEGARKVLLHETNAIAGKEQTLPLADKIFDLKNNAIELFFEVQLKQGEYRGADFEIQLQFVDYDFGRVEGKIVKPEGIAIERDYFNIDIDFLDEISGDFKFTEPQLKLVVRNQGLGLPVDVDMVFVGENEEAEQGILTLNQPLRFEGNASIDEIKMISQQVDKNNSNIVDFLSLPPQGNVYYSGNVILNPTEENNVFYRDASLEMDVHISIPLALTGELLYCDTLTDIDIDQEYADKIVEGKISLNVQENGLPLDMSVPRLVLLDENHFLLDTIAISTDKNQTSKIEAGKSGILNFNIDRDIAKKLGRTKNILLEVAVSGNSGKSVGANAKLKFTLMLEAQAEIKDYDDF